MKKLMALGLISIFTISLFSLPILADEDNVCKDARDACYAGCFDNHACLENCDLAYDRCKKGSAE